jgi:hypothetical protein
MLSDKLKDGAKKVAVFGFLVQHSRFTRWSDLDSAAWWIPDNRFYAAVEAVTGLSKDFKIDLVDAAACRILCVKPLKTKGLRYE